MVSGRRRPHASYAPAWHKKTLNSPGKSKHIKWEEPFIISKTGGKENERRGADKAVKGGGGDFTEVVRWFRPGPCPNHQTLFFLKGMWRSLTCESCCTNSVKCGAYLAMVNCTRERERERERERDNMGWVQWQSTNQLFLFTTQAAGKRRVTYTQSKRGKALRRSIPEIGHQVSISLR